MFFSFGDEDKTNIAELDWNLVENFEDLKLLLQNIYPNLEVNLDATPELKYLTKGEKSRNQKERDEIYKNVTSILIGAALDETKVKGNVAPFYFKNVSKDKVIQIADKIIKEKGL